MLDKSEYNILFASWINQYGVLYTNGYGEEVLGVPLSPPARQEMLRYLLGTLINDHGYQKTDFGDYTKGIITEACVNPGMKDKKKLEGWRSQVGRDIDTVLGEIYPSTFVKASKQDHKNKKQEKPQRLQKALDNTDKLPDEWFAAPELPPDAGSYDEEEVVINKPFDESVFDAIPDIHYPMLTHEELVAQLEKEIAEREEKGDE